MSPHILKMYCPTCKEVFLQQFIAEVLPKDLDGPPCQTCGTILELDTTDGNKPAKFSFYMKKKDRKHSKEVMERSYDLFKRSRLKQLKRGDETKD